MIEQIIINFSVAAKEVAEGMGGRGRRVEVDGGRGTWREEGTGAGRPFG